MFLFFMGSRSLNLLIFTTLLLSRSSSAAWWFSSGDPPPPRRDPSVLKLVGAEFALDSLDNDERAISLVDNAKHQMRVLSKSCWLNAYGNLFVGCSKIISDQNLKDRLTWELSDCFQKHSGREPFPHCDPDYPTKDCLKRLDGDAHKVFLQYFLQIDTICHQLQIHAFKDQTERLVNDLKASAEYAEDKLLKIEKRGETLLHNSNQIHGSLSSIDLQTQQLAQTSKDVENNVNALTKHSEQVLEQAKGIAASQSDLIEGQNTMKNQLNEGMRVLLDSYDSLGSEISSLKDETVEIEKEIGKVGEAMSSKMDTLQSKADDIENLTGSSLGKQKELLEGQSEALEGLRFLTTFQSRALEESRDTLQRLSEFGKKQQEELLNRQEQLQHAHNQLSENSKTILAAQEAFESKQANMLSALDKLFALHNSLLIESRSIKIFIIYSLLIFVLYMFTSMKQTYDVRPRLYLGLCVAFLIELTVVQCTTCDMEHQAWLVSWTRTVFLVVASLQLLYAICTYRDYEVLNHKMLLALVDKVNGMQRSKALQWQDEDSDDDVDWSSWVDEEIPEDLGLSQDPDYRFLEQVGENSVQCSSVGKRYNLRNRNK